MNGLHWTELLQFAARCELLGVQAPASITRGLQLAEIANAHDVEPPATILDLTDDQARARITDLAIRHHTGVGSWGGSTVGMAAGISPFLEQLGQDVRLAALPELEQMVAELRPRFDELAAPLTVAAQEFDISSETTPASIIDRADEAASAAYRNMRAAWHAIQPIVALRIQMSKVFGLSPTLPEAAERAGVGVLANPEQLNWSVAFAAGDNWSLDTGYLVESKRGNHLDWLSLAAEGLRLNSPEESRRKIAERARPSLRATIARVKAEAERADDADLLEPVGQLA